jgi:hypothetical protein
MNGSIQSIRSFARSRYSRWIEGDMDIRHFLARA